MLIFVQVNLPLEAQMMAQHQQAQIMHAAAYPAAAEQPPIPSTPESAAPQILGELQQLQLKQREQLEKASNSCNLVHLVLQLD